MKYGLRSLFSRNEKYSSGIKAAILGTLLSAMVCWCVPTEALAQTAATGALAGTVTDPSGAVIAGANVKVTNEASAAVRDVTTGTSGNYMVPLLAPGFYSIEVTKTGFKMTTFSHVQVIVTETNVLNAMMEVGQVTEEVTVLAQAEQLQTESSTLGRVTSGSQVQNLPLVMGNFTQIIALNPGVSSELENAGELGHGGGGNNTDNTVSNGGWSEDNNFQMNGIGVNDIQQSGSFSAGVGIPSPDAIEEFKVQTGQYDASYGRNAGANVDVITKGGGNDFHGSAFEFFRNNDLYANTFFLNAVGAPRAVLKQNRFGAGIGGPIIKDKLHFFTLYQGTRQRNGLDTACSANFTEAPITNDRSAAGLGKVFAGQRGFFQNIYGGVGPAIAADGSNIDPAALAILNLKLPNGQYYVPTPQTVNPNAPGGLDAEGVVAFSVPCPYQEDQFVTNADYQISTSSKLSARFFFANSNIKQTLPITNLTGNSGPPGAPVNQTQDFRTFSLTHTYIFTPLLINQATLGFHRILATFVQTPPFSYSQVGISVVPSDNNLPAIAMDASGSAGLSLGGNGQNVWLGMNTFAFQDAVSWTHGKHTFQFGAGLEREQDNQVKFHFLMGELFLSWSDFMLGLPAAQNGTPFSNMYGAIDLLGLFDRGQRDWNIDSYAEDTYKVTKHLTLNLGLRYDHIGDFGDILGRNSGFDLSLANPNPPAAGTLAGTTVPNNYTGPLPPGVSRLGNDYGMNGTGQNTWNPRVGFAWELPHTNDKLVLRGGYGVYHSRLTGQPFLQLLTTPPFGLLRYLTGPAAANLTEDEPLPLNPPPLPNFVPYSPTTQNTLTAFAPNYRPPLVQQYSLGIQAQLTPSMVFELGYSGSRGLHILDQRDIDQANLASVSNPIRGQTTNTVANIPDRIPYQGWSPSQFQYIESAASYWYNALLVSLNKRFNHGLQFQASYSWMKEMGTAFGGSTGVNGGTVLGNQNNLSSEYGLDNFIRPQRLVINYSYELPRPKSQSRFAQQALGGWTVLGVTVWQTGHYLTPEDLANSASVYGVAQDRASLTGTCTPSQYVNPGPVHSLVGTSNTYLNTSCFTTPGAFNPEAPEDGTGFGNAGVGIFRGPGELNFDFSVLKEFSLSSLREGTKLQFRSEFFNLFNHPAFADPDPEIVDATFGRITNTVGSPRIVQFALRLVF